MISVVLTYHNRLEQFKRTLRSLQTQMFHCDELIVVDDASDDDQAASIALREFSCNHNLIVISKEEKSWINPAVPYNRGFAAASGDTVLIQNAETLHAGRILHHIRMNIKQSVYLSYSAYSIDEQTTQRVCDFDDEYSCENMRDLLSPMDVGQWYNHPEHMPKGYHFCSAILKKDLDRVGGFNEEFSSGYCFEDDEFLLRLSRAGIIVEILPPEVGFVVHQWHPKPTRYQCPSPEWERNRILFNRCRK